MSTALSVVFVLGERGVGQSVQRSSLILFEQWLSVPLRALIALGEAVDHHVVSLSKVQLVWDWGYHAGGTTTVGSLLVKGWLKCLVVLTFLSIGWG